MNIIKRIYFTWRVFWRIGSWNYDTNSWIARDTIYFKSENWKNE